MEKLSVRRMLRVRDLALVILFLIIAIARNACNTVAASSSWMRLELIHRHGVGGAGVDYTSPIQRMKELLHSDIQRRQSITHRRKTWEQQKPAALTCNNSVMVMRMRAGRDLGIGQYFVEVSVGSPPQKLMLIADTASDLTWMRCSYNSRTHTQGRVFNPVRSSTFRTIPCSSRMCKLDLMNLFSLTRCPTPSSPCAYDYRYSDGSSALGIFANETITADLKDGMKMRLKEVLVGCSQSVVGQSLQIADGVLGLAYTKHSFTTKAAQGFGDTFSYCLVDHLSHINLSSYLTFGVGPTTAPLLAHMRYTKLELTALSPFYALNVMGISVGGRMLGIPPRVWAPSSGGGTIIDSGTSLTFLTLPVYQLVVGALEVELARFKRLISSDLEPLEYCFDATAGFEESLVPRLVIHFVDGARFEPPVKSYVIDAAPGIKCLGLLSATWPGASIIGNILQQNHVWEFNLVDGMLGYAPSACI